MGLRSASDAIVAVGRWSNLGGSLRVRVRGAQLTADAGFSGECGGWRWGQKGQFRVAIGYRPCGSRRFLPPPAPT